jgi:hypothetical protein
VPRRLKVRLADVSVRKPPRVTVKTACSVCLRSPIRSMRSLRATRPRAATAKPIGSRNSFEDNPCLPPGLKLLVRDMGLM